MATEAIPVGANSAENTKNDVCLPEAVFRRVYDGLGDEGLDVDESTVNNYIVDTPRQLENLGKPTDRVALIPIFVTGNKNKVASLIRSGEPFEYRIDDELEGARDIGGSEHITTLFVRRELGIEETIHDIAKFGGFELAKERIEPYTEYHNVDEIVAFATATYALGWIVEQIIDEKVDRYSKGSMSNDQASQDFYDKKNGEYVQCKRVTGYQHMPDSVGQLWYQFTCDGDIIIGDDDYKEVKDEAADVKGVSKTLTYRSAPHRYTFEGRGYRYMWW